MELTSLCALVLFSLNPLHYGRAEDRAVVTLESTWSQIYDGETVTLRCEIKGSRSDQWKYEWRRHSGTLSNQNGDRISAVAAVAPSGDYRCKGRMKRPGQYSTDWSEAIKLNVSYRPLPVLTVSPSWLSPGASVTLKCEVEHPSAGWRFYWYEAVPDLSNKYYFNYRYEPLPDSTSGTEQDSYTVHGQTHTAGYVCRAGRGDPVFYTYRSEPVFVWSGESQSSVSLTVSPDRAQHFTSDAVSLTCEGNSTKRVNRFSDSGYSVYCNWGEMNGSTCHMKTVVNKEAVYWCESASGEFSNAVNITAQSGSIILVSPVHPVTEGRPVTLTCDWKTQKPESSVFFYRNDELIQNDTRGNVIISAASKSDEGFYSCQRSGETSARSWMSVKVLSRSGSPSFPVQLTLRVVICGVLLLILLFLLRRCQLSKGSSFTRSVEPERTYQNVNTNRVANQDEAQCHQYSTLLHRDACLYESIKGPEERENVL